VNELWVMVCCYLVLFLAFVKRKQTSKQANILLAFFAFLVVLFVEQSELLLL
jgi:hypothetical protein